VGVGAVVIAGALALAVLARANEDAFVSFGARVSIVALLALVAALVRGWSALVPGSLVLLGSLYGAQLAVDEVPLDGAAPLVAAALVLVAELGYWSLEERDRVEGERGDDLRRLAYVALVTLAALAVTATLLALVDVVRARGLALDLLGAAAAATVLIAIVLATRDGAAPAGSGTADSPVDSD
jgi:hypothetical protein